MSVSTLVAVVFALQEPTPADGPPSTITTALAVTSDYVFRGIAQRLDSVNVQLGVDAAFSMTHIAGADVALVAGTWHDVSDDPSGAGTDSEAREHWYEADWSVGFTLRRERIALDLRHVWYTSPADTFASVNDVTAVVALDDSGWWFDESFAVAPSLAFAVETNGSAMGPQSGAWMRAAVAPTFETSLGAQGVLSFTPSYAVDIGLDDWFERADGSTTTVGARTLGARFAWRASAAAAGTTWLAIEHVDLEGAAAELAGRGDELVFSAGFTWVL